MNNLLTNFNGIKDIKKGSLVLLAARPFFGKTTFSYNIASDLIENNQTVKIYSFERTKEEIEETIKTINNNLVIDYNPNNTLDYILNNSDNYDLIIIETLQKLNIEESQIKKLKELATKTNSVIILISELPSSIDEREDKHPKLSDLSDNMVESIDYVLFMYGDYYYDINSHNKMITELTKIDTKTNVINNYQLLRHQDKCTFANYNE